MLIVTWSFRNHSNMLLWCSRYIYYHHSGILIFYWKLRYQITPPHDSLMNIKFNLKYNYFVTFINVCHFEQSLVSHYSHFTLFYFTFIYVLNTHAYPVFTDEILIGSSLLRLDIDLTRLPVNQRQLYTRALDEDKGRLVFLVTLTPCSGASISDIQSAPLDNPTTSEEMQAKYVSITLCCFSCLFFHFVFYLIICIYLFFLPIPFTLFVICIAYTFVYLYDYFIFIILR